MTLHGKQAELIAIPVIFPILTILLVAFRLRARVITREPYKANDYFIVVATVTTVTGSVAFVIAASTACLGGDGCSEDRIALWEKTFFIFQLLYIVSVSCIKVSILLFFKRVFQSRRFTQAVWAVVAVVALWGVAFFFSYLLGIWPISSRWNIHANISWEINLNYYYIANSATDVLTDLATLYLPLPMIGRLRMSGRNKLALLGAFALGFFASIAGVMRMIYAIKLRRASGTQDYSADEDASMNLFIWSTLEPCMGIICACLPLLHPYFKRHSPEALIGANSAGYGVIRGREIAHRDPKGLSIHMSHISDYHENVID